MTRDELIEAARLAFVEAWEGVNDNVPSFERVPGARSTAGIERADRTNGSEPSLRSRKDGLPTAYLVRRGLDPDLVVCPECAETRTGSGHAD